MSRTYYEWRDAKNAWLIAQHKRVASIPYPTKDSVVYQRESNNPFWEHRREHAESLIPLTALNYNEDVALELFQNIGQAEEDKERALLEKFLPNTEINDTDSLIDKINILMQGRERYNQLLERMERALAREKSKGAPNMSAFFATYLEPYLIQNMEQFQKEFITLDNPKERYEQLIRKSIQQASTRMANASIYEWDVSKGHYSNRLSNAGGREDWKEIDHALHTVPGMWDLFTANVMKSIGNWNALYSKLINDVTGTTKSNVQDLLQLRSRTFSIGGNVAENAYAAIAAQLGQLRGSNGSMSWSAGGGALTAEAHTTADAFLIFSADSEIDAQGVFDELNAAGDAGYKEQLANTVSQFKDNLNNLFGIFVNAKNYSIGLGQDASYTKEMSGTFEDLPSTFSELKVDVGNIEDFLHTAYNTGAGAIAAGMRGQVEESVIQALRVGAAKIMFDDFSTIGNTDGGNIIHLYQLSGKFVPSSVIFKSMADATKHAVSVRAKVTLPPSVNDPGPQGWEGSNDAEIKEAIYRHWKEEYETARDASTWYASFTLNLKSALRL